MPVQRINGNREVVAETRTTPSGYYSFAFFGEGMYGIRIQAPPGYRVARNAPVVRVGPLDHLKIDFLLYGPLERPR